MGEINLGGNFQEGIAIQVVAEWALEAESGQSENSGEEYLTSRRASILCNNRQIDVIWAKLVEDGLSWK